MNTRGVMVVGSLVLILSIMGLMASGSKQDAQTINQAIRSLDASWTAGETSISELSPEEQAMRCGTFLEDIPDSERMDVPVSKAVLPAYFDWRDVDGDNWTTSVKDQGSCGSCWDFSAVGVFEGLLDIASGNPADTSDEDLSEQHVLSCCDYCGSCDGGWTGGAFEFLRETGTVTELCFPYGADDSILCESACGEVPRQIGAWTYIGNDVESIKRAIYQYGPVSAAFTTYQDFYHYTGGVYEYVWGYSTGGHAVSIVGWDDDAEAWICKNSWGTDWGETMDGQPYTPGAEDGGWFRIKWGNCGINESVIMATFTSWPTGIVDVAVLDGLGHPVESARIYVNEEWYASTSHGGTASLDLIEGMGYEIMAFSSTDRLLLFDEAVAPASVMFDCRDASYVTATASKLDGSPLDVGLYFTIGDGLWRPEHTYDGTGWFYITPGVYDVQAWSWWDTTDCERYSLFLEDVDLTSSTSLSIDASALPTGQFVLQTLLDFTGLDFGICPEGKDWCFAALLEEGDSIICTPGSYWTWMTFIRKEGDWVTWNYGGPSFEYSLEDGQTVALEAGGELSLSAIPDQESYEPGTEARISTQMVDEFGNHIRWVERSDDTPSEPVTSIYRLGPDGGLEVFQGDCVAIPRIWDYFNPWMVVASPSGAKLIDGGTCLSCTEWIYIDADAELGTYGIRVSQQTHLGLIENTSSFEVVLPDLDPYEPNDTCENAYDLGEVPPAFTAEVAHFYDENDDWFAFNLEASGLLVIDTQPLGEYAYPRIYLYDACGGERLAYNSDYEAHVEYRAAPGTYYLKIRGAYGGGTDYTFSMDLLPLPAIGIQGNDPIEISIPAGSSEDFTDLLTITNVGQPGSMLNYRILWQEIPVDPSSMAMASDISGVFREASSTMSQLPRPVWGDPPMGNWDLLIVDGDEPQAVAGADLKELHAQIDSGVLYFKGTTYEPWVATEDLEIVIFLDIDQDASTGCSADAGWINMNDIGAEYALVLPYGSLLRFDSSGSGEWEEVGDLDYVYMPDDRNTFVVGVALINLMPKTLSETGGLNILFLLQDSSTGSADYAPDAGEGHACYPSSAGWFRGTPESGALTQGTSENITLTVDSTEFTPGEIHRVRLHFLSNDGNVTLTREVEVTVEAGVCQEFDTDLQATGWHMVSLPGQVCAPCTWVDGQVCGDLVCALEDDLDPFLAYHYDPEFGGYYRVPPADQICYQPGMSSWIYTTEENSTIDAVVTSIDGPVEIPLGNGWNQIGNPYTIAISPNTFSIRCGGEEKTLFEAEAAEWVSSVLYSYDPSGGNYFDVPLDGGYLLPWTGTWLRTFVEDCTLIFSPYPAPPPPPTAPLSGRRLTSAEAAVLELPPPPPVVPMGVVEALESLSAMNRPNPVRSEHTTVFKVRGAGAEHVDAIRVDIYGQNGALVFSERIDEIELVWHTVNDAGELLANGVYLYQVWVRIGEIWYPMEIQKLAVMR